MTSFQKELSLEASPFLKGSFLPLFIWPFCLGRLRVCCPLGCFWEEPQMASEAARSPFQAGSACPFP